MVVDDDGKWGEGRKKKKKNDDHASGGQRRVELAPHFLSHLSAARECLNGV